MTLPVETFQQRAARRKEPKALREGHEAVNDLIRAGRPTLDERYGQRMMVDISRQEAELDAREAAISEPSPPPTESSAVRAAGLDQGQPGNQADGAGHAPRATRPKPEGGSGMLRQALREARESRGE
jgi:hypothetical protein